MMKIAYGKKKIKIKIIITKEHTKFLKASYFHFTNMKKTDVFCVLELGDMGREPRTFRNAENHIGKLSKKKHIENSHRRSYLYLLPIK